MFINNLISEKYMKKRKKNVRLLEHELEREISSILISHLTHQSHEILTDCL